MKPCCHHCSAIRTDLSDVLRGAIRLWVAIWVAALSMIAVAATSPPEVWTVGGLDAGSNGAGQAGRVAVDGVGNVVVVSGPANGRLLAVTSYSPEGVLRWRSTAAPASGTFVGDWVLAAPNGDVLALGHSLDSRGSVGGVTVVRYASDGTLQWRVDSTGTVLSIGRLLVDASGNAYYSYNSTLYKYSPTGTLLWSTSTSVPDAGATLSPDGADVVLTGTARGGSTWVTAALASATGIRRWLVSAAEGVAAVDAVVDPTRVYVTGQGVTGAGTPALAYFMTVVAYDRATGTRLWRTDKRPSDSASAAGLRMELAPDCSVVVTGQASRGFLDWYTVSLDTSGHVRWEAVRDGGLNTDEIPTAVLTLSDGTTVVTGRGGPNLPGGYIPGVTVGYNTSGALVWQAFSAQATVWAALLPSGNVCTAGGYDAMVTCWGLAPPLAPIALRATALSPGTMRLEWISETPGWVLEESNDLVNWLPSVRVITTVGSSSTVTINCTGIRGFFRLAHP